MLAGGVRGGSSIVLTMHYPHRRSIYGTIRIEKKHLYSAKLIQHPPMCLRYKRESPGTCLFKIQISTHQRDIYDGGGYASLNKDFFNLLREPV